MFYVTIENVLSCYTEYVFYQLLSTPELATYSYYINIKVTCYHIEYNMLTLCVGGCLSGQVVMWDLSAHAERLKNQRSNKQEKKKNTLNTLPGLSSLVIKGLLLDSSSLVNIMSLYKLSKLYCLHTSLLHDCASQII